jgi:hypothetical protein
MLFLQRYNVITLSRKLFTLTKKIHSESGNDVEESLVIYIINCDPSMWIGQNGCYILSECPLPFFRPSLRYKLEPCDFLQDKRRDLYRNLPE